MNINIFKQKRDLETGKEMLALYKTGKYGYRRLGRMYEMSHEKAGQLIKLAIIEEEKIKGIDKA